MVIADVIKMGNFVLSFVNISYFKSNESSEILLRTVSVCIVSFRKESLLSYINCNFSSKLDISHLDIREMLLIKIIDFIYKSHCYD